MAKQGDKITGGCLCRNMRYEIDQAPFEAGYCHCDMCKKGLGNLFGAWVFVKHEDFRFVKGELSWYQSTKRVKRGFCANCGSPMIFQPDDVDIVTIWMGTLDDPAAFEPEAHWWTESKISWVDVHENLPVKMRDDG
jgi:hypothetical protein